MEEKDNIEIVINQKKLAIQKAIFNLSLEDQKLLNGVDWSKVLFDDKSEFFKAEEIGKILENNFTAEKVNDILIEMGYQIRLQKGDFLPTKKGVYSGCFHRIVEIENRNGSKILKFSNCWNIEIVDRIKEFIESKEKQEDGRKE